MKPPFSVVRIACNGFISVFPAQSKPEQRVEAGKVMARAPACLMLGLRSEEDLVSKTNL